MSMFSFNNTRGPPNEKGLSQLSIFLLERVQGEVQSYHLKSTRCYGPLYRTLNDKFVFCDMVGIYLKK